MNVDCGWVIWPVPADRLRPLLHEYTQVMYVRVCGCWVCVGVVRAGRRVMGLSSGGWFSVAAVLWRSASDGGCGVAFLCCVPEFPAVSALQCYLPLRLCLCKTGQAPLHQQVHLPRLRAKACMCAQPLRSMCPLKPNAWQHASASALWPSRGCRVPVTTCAWLLTCPQMCSEL